MKPRWRRVLADALRQPWLVAGCLAATCFLTAATISWVHWPQPRIHDEFSYLLAADTFAHGRLSNPTHPEWEHLETFHVIQQPTYASKYPPGQGIALAFGQVATGAPIVGVWLLSAVAAAVTYWMLLGATSPLFAALGGSLWWAHPSFQLAWGQSYWGGTLAFIGGALVTGAALRMKHRAAARDAVAMAAGALALAASRPFEGFVFCALVGTWLVWHWTRHGTPGGCRTFLARIVLPHAVILGVGVGELAYYQYAVTGNPFKLPYAIHEATYGQSPMFVGQSPAPKPEYHHAVLDDFHSGWEMDWYRRQSSPRGWINSKITTTWYAANFLLTPVMVAGLIATRPWRWRRLTPIVIIAALTIASALTVTWNLPHYFAPIVPLLLLVAVSGLRRIDLLCRRNLRGLRLAPALVGLQAALFLIAAVKYAKATPHGWFSDRAEILKLLEQSPEQHLILVRYGAGHSCHDEWVYNGADIDGAKVVWARAMTPERDAELRRYFRYRRAWLLEPESRRLVPYENQPAVVPTPNGVQVTSVSQ